MDPGGFPGIPGGLREIPGGGSQGVQEASRRVPGGLPGVPGGLEEGPRRAPRGARRPRGGSRRVSSDRTGPARAALSKERYDY